MSRVAENESLKTGLDRDIINFDHCGENMKRTPGELNPFSRIVEIE